MKREASSGRRSSTVDVEGFTAFIGNGENSLGRFPSNLSELHAALREFAALTERDP